MSPFILTDFVCWFENLLAYMCIKFCRDKLAFGHAVAKMHRLVFLEHGKFCWFSVIHVSQGSVATYVTCGGMSTQRCIANFLLSLTVKEFLKSVKI